MPMSTSAVARVASMSWTCVSRMSRALAPPTNHAMRVACDAATTSRSIVDMMPASGRCGSNSSGKVAFTQHPGGFEIARVAARDEIGVDDQRRDDVRRQPVDGRERDGRAQEFDVPGGIRPQALQPQPNALRRGI